MKPIKFFTVEILMLITCVLFSSCQSQKIIHKPLLVTEMDEKRLEGILDGSYEAVWLGMREVLLQQGEITFENFDYGQINSSSGPYLIEIRYNQMVYNRGLISIKAFDRHGETFDLAEAKRLYYDIQKFLLDQQALAQ